MPFVAVALFSALAGALTFSKAESVLTPSQPVTTADPAPSPYMLGLYAAGALGLYWLYRKASKA